MHPQHYARRMSIATQRLYDGLKAQAETNGAKLPEMAQARDPRLKQLFMVEWAAEAVNRAHVGQTGEDASLRDRLMKVRYVTEDNVDAVMAEVGREADEPLVDRLNAIDGIGGRTAKNIMELVGVEETNMEREPDKTEEAPVEDAEKEVTEEPKNPPVTETGNGDHDGHTV